MTIKMASRYREEQLKVSDIASLSETLQEDFTEVVDYRDDDRRVWVSLDHVEAIAIEHGKIFTWRFANATHDDLRNVLMRRFLPRKHDE
jgi:hypothetical protein